MAANIVTDALRKSQLDATSFAAVNFASAPLYALLVNTTGDSVADNTKRGYTFESDANGNEVTGTAYVARGQALTSLSVTQAAHVVTFTSANPNWAVSTITAFGVWLVNHSGAVGASPLVAYYTFGGGVSTNAGTFTITVNAAGWISLAGG